MLHLRTLVEKQTVSIIFCSTQNKSFSPFLKLGYVLGKLFLTIFQLHVLIKMFWFFFKKEVDLLVFNYSTRFCVMLTIIRLSRFILFAAERASVLNEPTFHFVLNIHTVLFYENLLIRTCSYKMLRTYPRLRIKRRTFILKSAQKCESNLFLG